MKEAYIIFDIGTGNVRVAVAATTGEILGIASEDIQYHKDHHYPESIYFDTDHLWVQIIRLASQSLSQAQDVHILALTATSQREGIVLLGKDGSSLIGLPNIDHRGREWEHIITDKSRVFQLSGRYPTSLFSAMKIVGVREKRADLWNNFSTFLSISDWVEYKLSGVVHYEHSQASETLLYDVAQKRWSEELCGLFNISILTLPKLTASGTIIGKILADKAASLNISPNAQIIVGGADTQLAVRGTQPETNDVVIVSGTTTPIIKLIDTYVTDENERTWTGRHVDESSFMFEAKRRGNWIKLSALKRSILS